ncbi:hypothetical protein [uncultured Methanobrevibacter sp.]|uniref:hypothetical protein n=1 Tax=uncultured Methanobrevibacter sp. TaxID=253161 RepID=UPI00261E0CE1
MSFEKNRIALIKDYNGDNGSRNMCLDDFCNQSHIGDFIDDFNSKYGLDNDSKYSRDKELKFKSNLESKNLESGGDFKNSNDSIIMEDIDFDDDLGEKNCDNGQNQNPNPKRENKKLREIDDFKIRASKGINFPNLEYMKNSFIRNDSEELSFLNVFNDFQLLDLGLSDYFKEVYFEES